MGSPLHSIWMNIGLTFADWRKHEKVIRTFGVIKTGARETKPLAQAWTWFEASKQCLLQLE